MMETLSNLVIIFVLPTILGIVWRIKTNDLHTLDVKIARIMEKLGMGNGS